MEDHNSLFAKIKNEPMDYGVFEKVMKSFDQLSTKSKKPGQVKFVLGDAQYSYIVTVKRFNKSQLINKTNTESTNSDIISQNTGNDRETEKGNSQELSTTSHKKKIVPFKTGIICLKKLIENDNDFDNTEPIKEFENNSFSEIIYEDEEELMSEESDVNEELMNQSDNELLYNDKGVQCSITPLDSEIRDYTGLKESPIGNTIVSVVKSEENSIFKCKLCQFMTAREDCLTAHIKIRHEGESTINNNSFEKKPPDVDEKHNEMENKLVCKKGIKTGPKKKVRKRVKALNEFLELLNNGTKFIKPFCNKSEDNQDLQDKSNESNELHKCLFCSFTCNDRTELYRHIGLTHAHSPNEHYNEGRLKTDCTLCPFKGIHRKSLMLHLRTKHRRGRGFQCKQCQYKTHNKPNFDRHVEVVHDKKRDIKCPECDFLTTRNYLLVKHMMKKHKGMKPYRCTEPDCNFSSTSSSSRKAHIMEVHNGLKSHVCNIESCNFATSRISILKSHMYKAHHLKQPTVLERTGLVETVRKKVNVSKGPFLCPHCPHQSTQKGSLQKHIRIKHLGQCKRYKCADCNFSATEKYFVRVHISEVHLGQYAYSCHLCEFKCSIKQRFERHVSAVHMGQKPYHCEFCDYKGSQQIHLQRHIEVIHRREKPHFCIYCNFNTAHRANLRSHLKSKHRVSDLDVNKVLLSCVDLRVNTKQGVKNAINEENSVTEEVVYVPETTETIIGKKPNVVTEESRHKATIVTEPAIVSKPSIPHHNIHKVDNLRALEASLLREKIDQHQSLAIADSTVVEQSHRTNCLKPIQGVVRRQLTTDNRIVYVFQPQNKKILPQEIQKQIHVINTNIKHVN